MIYNWSIFYLADMKKIESLIRNIPDFPKAGIQFKDITPLLKDPDAVREAVDAFVSELEGKKIDKVVGIEARGFFFGMLLADRLNAGFVPIRKPGKLPYKTYSENYELEYDINSLEIHQDAIVNGEHVLIHDDVLATGGTARAACNLIEKMGGKIVQCNFLMEISFLDGAKKLEKYPLHSLIKY